MAWTLNDTVGKMRSNDYKERFLAEYMQTKIRYEKLKAYCNKIEASRRCTPKVQEPPHDCSYELLREQQNIMGNYLHVLEIRAVIEDVNIGQEAYENGLETT